VAEAYERSRPGYAPTALAWLAERIGIGPGRRVLDLAAGTGKLTRQLLTLGADVVAVEPGDEMRGVLVRVVSEAETLAGSAEAIPLPDAAVDAVTVGQAFHWFRTEEALGEIHRVLRPGGALALLWNEWDHQDPLQRRVPLDGQHLFQLVLRGHRDDARPGISEDERSLLRCLCGINGNRDRAQGKRREISDRPLRAIFAEDGDAIAFANTPGFQRASDSHDAAVNLRGRDRNPA